MVAWIKVLALKVVKVVLCSMSWVCAGTHIPTHPSIHPLPYPPTHPSIQLSQDLRILSCTSHYPTYTGYLEPTRDGRVTVRFHSKQNRDCTIINFHFPEYRLKLKKSWLMNFQILMW